MVSVVKATGEKEPFSEAKVLSSIKRAGIPQELEREVLEHVRSKLHEDIKTSEIYNHIKEFLGQSKHPYTKARYSLKQAIIALGPTGYPFEDYIAELLQSQGYTTQTRQILQGKCITHEVDVVARKGAQKVMIEAKFHNVSGIKTNVHVVLYTEARFNDVLEKNDLNQAWLITNTKITSDAITYALCMGMKVTSWDYPEGEGLRDLIEEKGLSPITALTTLSQAQQQEFLSQHIVLCKDICSNTEALSILHLSEEKRQTILAEAAFACSVSNASR